MSTTNGYDRATSDEVKDLLEPKGRIRSGFRGIFKGNAEERIAKLITKGVISEEKADALKQAVDLRRAIEKADKTLRLGDKENASLEVSTKLEALKKTLKMCASGKDRTGLAEHDATVDAIARKKATEYANQQYPKLTQEKLDSKINEVNAKQWLKRTKLCDEIIPEMKRNLDKAILKGGHTAQQAGGISAGGATIGCCGTKHENLAGIPASRENLAPIVETTAQSNKIKEGSKTTELNEYRKTIKQEVAQNTNPKVSQQGQKVNTTLEKTQNTAQQSQVSSSINIEPANNAIPPQHPEEYKEVTTGPETRQGKEESSRPQKLTEQIQDQSKKYWPPESQQQTTQQPKTNTISGDKPQNLTQQRKNTLNL